MKEIAAAIQEGASAYLARQFKTLSIFAVIVFFVLFLLPAETTSERIGRSIFFLVGAVFSAVTGYVGMSLAVRANVRVAAAAREGGTIPSSARCGSPSAPAAWQGCSRSASDCSARRSWC